MSEQEYGELMVLVGGIPVARWGVMKAEAFVGEESFIWVDDNPNAAALDLMDRSGLQSCLVIASTDHHHDDLVRVKSILAESSGLRSVLIAEGK